MSLSVGVVGLGVISQFYVKAIDASKDADLVAVCDPDPKRLGPYEKRRVLTFETHDDLLRDDKVDAVVVTAPNNVHFEICTAALERGCSVCCEKPLTINVTDADELVLLAERQEKTLFTAFHRRYNCNFRKLLDKIDGPVRKASIRYHEDIREHAAADSWYLDARMCGGGCVADNGPNAFDMLMELLGPLSIERAIINRDRSGIDMWAAIDASSERGAAADVELDWRYPHGELKDLRVELYNGRILQADLLESFTEFKSSLAHEYIAIVEDFVRAVQHGSERGERGRDVVRLVKDAYASA